MRPGDDEGEDKPSDNEGGACPYAELLSRALDLLSCELARIASLFDLLLYWLSLTNRAFTKTSLESRI